MQWFSVLSYACAALSFLLLLVLLLTRWRNRFAQRALVISCIANIVWAVSASAAHAYATPVAGYLYSVLDAARYLGWLGLLHWLWQPLHQGQTQAVQLYRWLRRLSIALLLFLLFSKVWPGLAQWLSRYSESGLHAYLMLAVSLACGVLTEQLYRRTRPEQRWAIKFLCMGLGVIFAFDFYLYTNMVLFRSLNEDIEAARGFINVLAIPLILVALKRNPGWSLELFISRSLILRSFTVLAAGIYLILMAIVGFYIRATASDVGDALRMVFFAVAIIGLVLLAISGQVRARAKIFIAKHFFNLQYDYREEWLRLLRTLSDEEGGALYVRSMRALAEMVEASGAQLWWCEDDENKNTPRATFIDHWCLPLTDDARLPENVVHYMSRTGWLIDVNEYRKFPERYGELQLPESITADQNYWFLLPLYLGKRVAGIAVFGAPRAPRAINWEVRDLLKTAGQQVAGFISLYRTTVDLMDARQFEAYNRLSAFVVHDLKNVGAQLSLITTNAEKHREKQAFVDDAFATVANASTKIERMLASLRKGSPDAAAVVSVALDPVIRDAVNQCSSRHPVPQLPIMPSHLWVRADAERLTAIVLHVLQNAQEACAENGWIQLQCSAEHNDVLLQISDNGHGMEAAFVRDRLFRPFDTTKGNAGMGIGVYQARETLRHFGGELSVVSTPGQGSCFTLRLVRVITENGN